jgi:hypothetical protein
MGLLRQSKIKSSTQRHRDAETAKERKASERSRALFSWSED